MSALPTAPLAGSASSWRTALRLRWPESLSLAPGVLMSDAAARVALALVLVGLLWVGVDWALRA